MNWITKLERKYGRFCIPQPHQHPHRRQIWSTPLNCSSTSIFPFIFSLSRSALFAGQIWRLFLCCWCLFGRRPLSVVLAIYFTWFIGSAGTGVGQFPLPTSRPAGDGRRVAGLPADRLCRYLLSVPLLLLAFCHALPGAAGAALLHHPPQVKYFGIFAAA